MATAPKDTGDPARRRLEAADARRLHRRLRTTPPTASPRSRSAGPRSATRSGPARCSNCGTRSRSPATTREVGVDHLHRRGPRRVLLGWRPARTRRRRLPRRQGHRPPQRPRSAGADPPACRSRWSRWSRATRSAAVTCCTSCATSRSRPTTRASARPARASAVRRRLRLGPARAHRRPEEGARDLVPVRAVRRAGRARHGSRQHRRAARRSRGRDRRVGARRC